MTLIDASIKPRIKHLNQFSKSVVRDREVLVLRCDTCQIEFETELNVRLKKHRKHHFCSRECQGEARRPGGCLHYVYSQFQSAFSKPEIRERIERTMEKRYGAKHTLSAPSLRSKVLATTKALYGFDYPVQIPHVKVNYDYRAIAKKAHATMKANGSYRSSKEEEEFHKFLLSIFQNVIHPITINDRWPIDFYIPSISLYIQYDGVYWHGLDRPLEVIATSNSSRDKIIHQKWLTDREQETWFRANGMKLLRVPSTAFDRKAQKCIMLEEAILEASEQMNTPERNFGHPRSGSLSF